MPRRANVFIIGSVLFAILTLSAFIYKASLGDVKSFLKSHIAACNNSGTDDCYKNLSQSLSKRWDYKEVMLALKETENDPAVFSRCHELSHFIGRNAYKSDPNIQDLFENASPACWGGFYHGVIEGYFDAHPYNAKESFAKEIETVCGNIGDYSVPRLFDECVHGIGHGVMFVTDNDINKSLAWCDTLPDEGTRNTCYGGVFMENSSSSTETASVGDSAYLEPKDPLYPCDSLAERYLKTCYQYQGSYFAFLAHWDIQKNAALCMLVPERYRSGCFTIIGSNQVGGSQSISEMNDVCEHMPAAHKNDCRTGVVSGLTGRYINDPKKSFDFCESVPDESKKSCFVQAGSGISRWSSNTSSLKSFCDITPEERLWCLQGLTGETNPSTVL